MTKFAKLIAGAALLVATAMPALAEKAPRKPILLVLTNHGQLGETGKPTGFFLSEASHPWAVFTKAGYPVKLASPRGGAAPVDPKSYQLDDTANADFWKAFGDEKGSAVENTIPLAEVNAPDYAAVFFAGGHGTMWDFPNAPEVNRVIEAINEAGGVVAAVCHGPVALVGAKAKDGTPLVKGKKIAVFTNDEEAAVKLTEVVPFLPESRFKELGAEVVTAPNFTQNAIRDGKIVTGQNPASATRTAELVVEALQAEEESK